MIMINLQFVFFVFFADSEKERLQWISAIEQVIKVYILNSFNNFN